MEEIKLTVNTGVGLTYGDVIRLYDRIAELEADILIRDRALVRRNDEIARLSAYIAHIGAYPEQVSRILSDFRQADKEVE